MRALQNRFLATSCHSAQLLKLLDFEICRIFVNFCKITIILIPENI